MAATDERARHELYLAFEDLIGTEKADTLMAALLPSDRYGLATKADLATVEARLQGEVKDLRAEMHDQFRQQFRSTVLTVAAMNSAMVAAIAAFTG